jgi:hypothetical protein
MSGVLLRAGAKLLVIIGVLVALKFTNVVKVEIFPFIAHP